MYQNIFIRRDLSLKGALMESIVQTTHNIKAL